MEREREKEQSGEQGGGKRYYLWGGWMGGCRRAMHRQHLVLAGRRMARSLPANVRKCRSRAIS